MQLSITNYRRIQAANINLKSVTILAGQNGAGKTSVAQALGSLLTHDANIWGIAKKNLGEIIHSGQKQSSISVRDADWAVSISVGDVKLDATTTAPRISRIAAGIDKFSSLSKEQATSRLISAMQAIPNEQEIVAALTELVEPEIAQNLSQQIQAKGWDKTQSELEEGVKKLKGQWHEVTKENWGAQKGATWVPAIIAQVYDKKSENDYVSDISAAELALEKALAESAVEDYKIQGLRATASSVQQHEDLLISAQNALSELEIKLKAADEKVSSYMPQTSNTAAGESFPCPHCEGKIERKAIGGGFSYVKAEDAPATVDKAKQKELAMEHARNCGEQSRLQDAKRSLEKSITDSELKIEAAKEAWGEIQKMEAALGNKPTLSADEATNLRDAVATARSALEAHRAMIRSQELHQRIVRGIKIVDLLSPEGIRKTKMLASLEAFNRNLAQLSAYLQIEPVNIDTDMNVYAGRRSYKFLSASTQFRADVVLQAGFARAENAAALIIDGADIVLGNDRQGILDMLISIKIPTLFCIALTKPENVPAIWQMEGGAAYWLNDGGVTELGVQKANAAA